MGSHVHEMRQETGKVWKCSSCLFRCAQSALSTVKAKSVQHRMVKRGDQQASTVWALPTSSDSRTP